MQHTLKLQTYRDGKTTHHSNGEWNSKIMQHVFELQKFLVRKKNMNKKVEAERIRKRASPANISLRYLNEKDVQYTDIEYKTNFILDRID